MLWAHSIHTVGTIERKLHATLTGPSPFWGGPSSAAGITADSVSDTTNEKVDTKMIQHKLLLEQSQELMNVFPDMRCYFRWLNVCRPHNDVKSYTTFAPDGSRLFSENIPTLRVMFWLSQRLDKQYNEYNKGLWCWICKIPQS